MFVATVDVPTPPFGLWTATTRRVRTTVIPSVETTAQTGVEMEALVGASVAALTVYDMAKAIDKEMRVTDVHLLEKTTSPA